MKDPIIRRIVALFATVAAVLVVVAVVALRNIGRATASSDWVNQTNAAILELGSLRASFHASDAALRTLVVTGVEPGGQAEAAGLQRGDIIQEVNHETVKTVDDYLKAANKIKKDELAVLLVNRQGNSLFVAVNPK